MADKIIDLHPELRDPEFLQRHVIEHTLVSARIEGIRAAVDEKGDFFIESETDHSIAAEIVGSSIEDDR